jgi:hypothetical protein
MSGAFFATSHEIQIRLYVTAFVLNSAKYVQKHGQKSPLLNKLFFPKIHTISQSTELSLRHTVLTQS